MPVPEGYRVSALRKWDALKEKGFVVSPVEPEGSPIMDYLMGFHDPKNDPRLTSEEKLSNEYSTMEDYLRAHPEKYTLRDAVKAPTLLNLVDQVKSLAQNAEEIPGAMAEGVGNALEYPYQTAEGMVKSLLEMVKNPGRAISEDPLNTVALPLGLPLATTGIGAAIKAGPLADIIPVVKTVESQIAKTAAKAKQTAAKVGSAADQAAAEIAMEIAPKRLLPSGSYAMPSPKSALERLKTDMLRHEGPFADVLSDVDKILPEPSAMNKIDELLEGIPDDLLEDTKAMGLLPSAKRKVGPRPNDTQKGTYVPQMETMVEDMSTPDPRSFQIEQLKVSPDKRSAVFDKLVKDFGSGEAMIGGARATLVKRGKGYGLEITQRGVTHTIPQEITGNVKVNAAKRVMEILGIE